PCAVTLSLHDALPILTGFALGFGLLTTDACQRFYAKSAGGFRTTRAQFRLGALSVQDMSFLLAVQLEVRGYDRRERKLVLARLRSEEHTSELQSRENL